MPIDNNHKNFVIVFLGDLGNCLSYKEQQYWKSFNVIPEGKMSRTAFKRSLLAEFAPPEKSDLLFKQKFHEFNILWRAKFRWALFKPLREVDSHYYRTLRIPLINSINEFESQILALTKILIESLNEQELGKHINLKKKQDISGISKLEEFFRSKNIFDYNKHINFLRDLYNLRSRGIAHRKGKNYIEIAKKFKIHELSFIEIFDDILRKAISLLEFLKFKLL